MSQISVDAITDEAGTGAPSFPNGLTGDGSSLTGINAHKPVAVTGTTPSLNVGTYNFFDQGALTADTTVSFTSVPTDARWQYSFIATVDPTTLSDLGGVVYSQESVGVSGQGTTPNALTFSTDGLAMYTLLELNGEVFQYTLSTAWDVRTAAYSAKSYQTVTQTGQAQGVRFKPDGTKMYILDRSNDAIFQYSLSTAWDVSTASYDSKSLPTLTQDGNPYGMDFSSDGTKAYMVGNTGATIYQYTLSTAWDVSTGSYASKSFVLDSPTGQTDISFSSDGGTLFSLSVADDTVHQHTLSTAWDVATLSAASKSFTIASHEGRPQGIVIMDGGASFAILGLDKEFVYTFNMALPYVVTLPVSIVSDITPLTSSDVGVYKTYDFITHDAGTTVYTIT